MAQLVHWSAEARANLRAIDRETALFLLRTIARFAETRAGDVKQLRGFNPPRFRLRAADWRVVFRELGEGGAIEIIRVGHRSRIYR